MKYSKIGGASPYSDEDMAAFKRLAPHVEDIRWPEWAVVPSENKGEGPYSLWLIEVRPDGTDDVILLITYPASITREVAAVKIGRYLFCYAHPAFTSRFADAYGIDAFRTHGIHGEHPLPRSFFTDFALVNPEGGGVLKHVRRWARVGNMPGVNERGHQMLRQAADELERSMGLGAHESSRRKGMRYEVQPETMLVAEDVGGLGSFDGDGPALPTKAERARARAECASGAREFAWMRVDICMTRQKGARQKLEKLTGDGSLPSLGSSREAYEFVKRATRVLGTAKEHFFVIPLDSKLRPLGIAIISIGSLNAAIVHPREAFQPAVLLSAHSIVVGHNHPSDDVTPSPEDEALTRRLVAAGDVLGIQVLDHIVIGIDSWYSFADNGRLR